MSAYRKALVIQTAFLGDLILTLPMIQVLKRLHPELAIDVVVRADVAPVLANHPDIAGVIPYDKRGRESGLAGFIRLAQRLSGKKYDIALVPHRSVRSAALAWAAGIPRKVGFDRSAGRWLLNEVIGYDGQSHEYRRNLDLLQGIGDSWQEVEYPRLYPSEGDVGRIDALLEQGNIGTTNIVAIAPGTLWNTKRWLPERFAEVARGLRDKGFSVVLIGGPDDADLCANIAAMAGNGVISAAGRCSPLQSAELIRRCAVLLTNDSAPLHLGVAVGTPVAAIFGATTPSIGFAPYGPRDIIIENTELACRPCAIHGGDACPIKTFVCMKTIMPDDVLSRLLRITG